jgi:hypothetical protein
MGPLSPPQKIAAPSLFPLVLAPKMMPLKAPPVKGFALPADSLKIDSWLAGHAGILSRVAPLGHPDAAVGPAMTM